MTFEELREQGFSLRQIARVMRVSHETARRKLAGFERPLRMISKPELYRKMEAQWRAMHPGYMSEYCKAWRERKQRQQIAIERTLEAADRWEHARRCAEISAEARGIR